MFSSTVLVLLLSPLVWLVYRIIEWQHRLARVRKTMPAYGLWIEPYSLLRRLVPTRWQTFFPDWQFQERRKFDSLGTNIIPIVCLFGKDSFYISDPEAVVEIYSNQTRFPKDLKLYGMGPSLFLGGIERLEVLVIYGQNVVTTEGATWRLHRKITSKPFSERNNQLVHDETVRQTIQMLSSLASTSQNGKFVVEKPGIETMKLSLHVISGAGFGVPFTWESSSEEIWPGHKLSFRKSIETVLHHLGAIVLVPRLLWKLPIQYLRDAEEGYEEFGTYMRELLDRERKLGKESDGQNLLSALVKHSATEIGEGEEQGFLQDQEIIGNTFIFLIAGHETTAHTLQYAFLMLALHPSLQDTLYNDIQETIGDRLPKYEDFPNLIYPLCVMLETLRMFPPVVGMPRLAIKDDLLLGKYYIPKDTSLIYDTVNLQRNPKYWGPDIDVFDPSRFDGRNISEPKETDNGEKERYVPEKIRMPAKGAFMPFSEGSRSCLGRKFAQVEVVACLVVLAQRWRIELQEGWTKEKVWEVIDKSITIITLAPATEIPLVFKRR